MTFQLDYTPATLPQKEALVASTGRICLKIFLVERKSLNIILWLITNLMVSKVWKPHHLQHISVTLALKTPVETAAFGGPTRSLHSHVCRGHGRASAWPSLFLWAAGPWAFPHCRHASWCVALVPAVSTPTLVLSLGLLPSLIPLIPESYSRSAVKANGAYHFSEWALVLQRV